MAGQPQAQNDACPTTALAFIASLLSPDVAASGLIALQATPIKHLQLIRVDGLIARLLAPAVAFALSYLSFVDAITPVILT